MKKVINIFTKLEHMKDIIEGLGGKAIGMQ